MTLADPQQGTPPPGTSVGMRAAIGVLWMTAQKWVARVGGLVTIAILTRLLTPEDFGLLAAASSVMTLIYVLSDAGFSTYIVQAERIDRGQLSTAFWFSIVSGLVLGGIIFAGAPLLAMMFRLPEVVPILRTMTISVVLIALSSVPLAILRRRMAFKALAAQDISAAIVAQVVAIVAAFMGAGVWALVLQLLTAQVITFVLVWVIARWVPSRTFVASEFVAMARFGVQVVAHGLVTVVRGWAETAIIVAGLGVRDLGYWNIAQRLIQTATELSASALFPVSTVAFAKTRSSLDSLRAAHGRAMGVSQAVVTPVMVFLAVSAPVLVPFLFGSEWGTSALVVSPLAVAAILTIGTAIDHGLYYGVGRPGRWFVFTVVIYGLSVALTAVAVGHGLFAVAAAFVGAAFAETVGRWFMVGRLLEMSAIRTARPFFLVVAPTVASALAGLGVASLLAGAPALVALAAVGLALVVVYGALLRLVAASVWGEVVALVRGLLSRRGTRRSAAREVPATE